MLKSCLMTKIFHLTFIFWFPELIFAREEWRDPHEMHIRVHNHAAETKHECHCPNNDEKNYFCIKQLVNKIVTSVNYKRDSQTYEGQLNINLNKEDYDFLEGIRSGNSDFRLGHFSQVLQDSVYIEDPSFIITTWERISLWIQNENVMLGLCLMVTLFGLWKLQPHKYTFTMLFKLFLPLVYISDFCLRYKALLEEVEIDNYIESKQYERCDPNELGWFNWFVDKITGYCADSQKHYMMSQRAATHIITPMKVLTQQFDVIIPVLKYLGEGFGKFMYAIVVESPWYVKPFVAIFAFILVTIILLMMGARLFGISPRFNFLYLLNFDFRLIEHSRLNEHREQHTDRISGENLKTLLESRNQNSMFMLGTPSEGIPTRINAPITFKTMKKNKQTKRPFQVPNLMKRLQNPLIRDNELDKICYSQTESDKEQKCTSERPKNPSVRDNKPDKTCHPQTESDKQQRGTSWPDRGGGDQPSVIKRPIIEFD